MTLVADGNLQTKLAQFWPAADTALRDVTAAPEVTIYQLPNGPGGDDWFPFPSPPADHRCPISIRFSDEESMDLRASVLRINSEWIVARAALAVAGANGVTWLGALATAGETKIARLGRERWIGVADQIAPILTTFDADHYAQFSQKRNATLAFVVRSVWNSRFIVECDGVLKLSDLNNATLYALHHPTAPEPIAETMRKGIGGRSPLNEDDAERVEDLSGATLSALATLAAKPLPTTPPQSEAPAKSPSRTTANVKRGNPGISDEEAALRREILASWNRERWPQQTAAEKLFPQFHERLRAVLPQTQ